MALAQQSQHSERLNGDLTFNNGTLAELETRFLQERICVLQSYLAEKLPSLSKLGANWSPLGWCRCFQLEPARCEAELLAALLHNPERQHIHLEEMLGYRLDHLAKCARQRAYTHHYDEAYWQVEFEHQAATKILNDWWRWLKQVNK